MSEYIERGALLADIDAAMDNAGMGYVIGQTIKRYVKRQTAADVVEVKHGRWRLEISPERNATLKCTECDYIAPHELDVHRYCPNCGAKMDGE